MNSMGVDPFVHSLYKDLNSGLVLLQVSWLLGLSVVSCNIYV